MSPELLVQLVQLGSTGLLGIVLYFGLQANAKMLEILADALKTCMSQKAEMENRLGRLEREARQEETD